MSFVLIFYPKSNDNLCQTLQTPPRKRTHHSGRICKNKKHTLECAFYGGGSSLGSKALFWRGLSQSSNSNFKSIFSVAR